MEYSVNKIFDSSECNSIIDYLEQNGTIFSYTKELHWDCKRIANNEFTDNILNKLINIHSLSTNQYNPFLTFNLKNYSISLTKYYDGRWLDLHLDQNSSITSVIVLSDNFEDGRFLLSNSSKLTNGASKAVPLLGSVPTSKVYDATKVHLEIGEAITFNGMEVYHGVLPVTTGIRYALNIWMTSEDHKFIEPSTKSII